MGAMNNYARTTGINKHCLEQTVICIHLSPKGKNFRLLNYKYYFAFELLLKWQLHVRCSKVGHRRDLYI